MRAFLCGILFVLTLVILLCPIAYAGNLSVYSYSSNYIIWDLGGNTEFSIDGVSVEGNGETYGQYNLAPMSEHIGCNNDGNCTGITTMPDSISVFLHWGIYLLMIVFIIASYYIPITAAPALIYGVYLINTHLPSISADGSEYIFVSVLLICGIVAAFAGWNRKR